MLRWRLPVSTCRMFVSSTQLSMSVLHSYSLETEREAHLLCDELTEGLDTELLLELMMVSNAYGVTRLEQLCARKLITRLESENVEEIGRCAHLIGSCFLLRAA